MKQTLFSFSLLLLIFTSLYSPNTAATTSSLAPKVAPSPKGAAAATTTATAPTSKPLVPTSPDSSSDSSTPDDITKILKKAKTFTILTRLLKTTEIMNNINSQLITAKSGGLTILAPDDTAFTNLKAGFLNSLNENKKIELLQFHILPQYVDSNNFDSLSNPVQTVAGKDPVRLPLNVESFGNSVNISTGVVNASVTGVVYSDNKLAIYRLDKVLIPLDFVSKAKAPSDSASASAPVVAKAPKADKEKSSAEDDDGDVTTQDQKSSGVVSLIAIQGTAFIAFAALAALWS